MVTNSPSNKPSSVRLSLRKPTSLTSLLVQKKPSHDNTDYLPPPPSSSSSITSRPPLIPDHTSAFPFSPHFHPNNSTDLILSSLTSKVAFAIHKRNFIAHADWEVFCRNVIDADKKSVKDNEVGEGTKSDRKGVGFIGELDGRVRCQSQPASSLRSRSRALRSKISRSELQSQSSTQIVSTSNHPRRGNLSISGKESPSVHSSSPYGGKTPSYEQMDVLEFHSGSDDYEEGRENTTGAVFVIEVTASSAVLTTLLASIYPSLPSGVRPTEFSFAPTSSNRTNDDDDEERMNQEVGLGDPFPTLDEASGITIEHLSDVMATAWKYGMNGFLKWGEAEMRLRFASSEITFHQSLRIYGLASTLQKLWLMKLAGSNAINTMNYPRGAHEAMARSGQLVEGEGVDKEAVFSLLLYLDEFSRFWIRTILNTPEHQAGHYHYPNRGSGFPSHCDEYGNARRELTSIALNHPKPHRLVESLGEDWASVKCLICSKCWKSTVKQIRSAEPPRFRHSR